MDKTKHTVNGHIIVIPDGEHWIASNSSRAASRLEFLDLEVDSLDTLREWFSTSSRIAGAHTSRILDAGVVFDVDGKLPGKPLLFVESIHQAGLTLEELLGIDSSSELVSRILFRAAFALGCLSTSLCRHGALSSVTTSYSVERPVLPHPRSSPRSKPLDPIEEFRAFISETGLSGNVTDSAYRFLEESVVPVEEEDWTKLYNAEPTSWLLGFEDKLDLLLKSVDFAHRNHFRGVNVIGRMEWGAGVLTRDFCISSRLFGNFVVESSCDSLESLTSSLSVYAIHENKDIRNAITGILRISAGARIDLVINSLNSSDNVSVERMVTHLLEVIDSDNIRIIVFSDKKIDCSDLFSITQPFERAGKRGLLSRVTSRRMDRTPDFFGDWTSSFEYYQLITNCRGNRTLEDDPNVCISSTPGQASATSVPVLQGCSTDSISCGKTGDYPYLILLTGVSQNLSVWMPEQDTRYDRQHPNILREHLLTNGCRNLRELDWSLNDSSIPSRVKCLLLNRYFEDSEELINIEDRLGFIGKIALGGIDLETAISLTGTIRDISDSRRDSVYNLDSEQWQFALRVIEVIKKFDLPAESRLILGMLRLCTLKGALLFSDAITFCKGCIALRRLDLAAVACVCMLAPPGEPDDLEDALAVLADLKELADSEEQRWMFEAVITLLCITTGRKSERTLILFNSLDPPDPARLPGIYAFWKSVNARETMMSEVIPTIDVRNMLADAQFIASLSGFKYFAYGAAINEISLGRLSGSLTAWEAQEHYHNHLNSRLRDMQNRSQPIPELAMMLGASLQQMNMTRADSLLNQLLDCWKVEIKSIRDSYKVSSEDHIGGIDLEIIFLGLATSDLDSLWQRLTLIGLGHIVPGDKRDFDMVSILTHFSWHNQEIASPVRTLVRILDASRSRMTPEELKTGLSELDKQDTSEFLNNLRSGDLLNAYLILARMAASNSTGWMADFRGHLKVIRALERRYRKAGLPLIDGSTPLELIAGPDWDDNLSVKRSKGRLPVPDTLGELRVLLVCDAVWLFEMGPSGCSVKDRAAPDFFAEDVSWLRGSIRKLKHTEPYKVIDIPGSGWAAGHSIPATASVKLDAPRGNAVEFSVLIAESIGPGKALTKRQKVLLSDYARAISGREDPT
ncbi:MAG: hypothetical protein KAR44_00930 [Candidatus Aegiribacteria sp.]|nr:hypothetical protein [Candidatus Aegiribacteria sp.]